MRALIYGISGQDGGYLAQFLLEKGYEVWGASRDANKSQFENLKTLGIGAEVRILSATLTDFRSVLNSLKLSQPDEIYNLAGQSSVSLSFEEPVETMDSVCFGTLNLLESIRFSGSKSKLYNASSSECFGDVGSARANETTLFQPRSPYGVAKSAAHWQVANYRDAYGIFACNGILFNHESPLRPPRFVTRKIISAVARIAKGEKETLHLGNMDIVRDWGWAPEYVRAMWLMLHQPTAEDFVIATGQSYSLREFVECAFAAIGKNANEFLEPDATLLRPSEILCSYADPGKAARLLHWSAANRMPDVVRLMLDAELV